MSPHRTSPSGSYVVDLIFPGVGRIRRASKITRESQWRVFRAALEEVRGDERWIPALRLFNEKQIDGPALLLALKKGDPSLVRSDSGEALVTALAAWREDTKGEVSADTYRVRKELVTMVGRVVPAGAKLSALPAALRALRAQMAHAPRQFNLLRDYARAFARDTVGRRSELYLDVVDVPMRTMARKVSTAPTTHPLTAAEVERLVEAFGVVWRSKQGSRGAELVAMVLTGTNPKEYFGGSVRCLSDRVHVAGTKRAARERDVPKLYPCPLWPDQPLARPGITQTSFARALTIACAAAGVTCTPYDLRRTFANWLESAGIPRTRRRMYLGHVAGDVTDLYERHDVARFLAEDGETLRRWITANARPTKNGGKSGNSPDFSPGVPITDREVPMSASRHSRGK